MKTQSILQLRIWNLVWPISATSITSFWLLDSAVGKAFQQIHGLSNQNLGSMTQWISLVFGLVVAASGMFLLVYGSIKGNWFLTAVGLSTIMILTLPLWLSFNPFSSMGTELFKSSGFGSIDFFGAPFLIGAIAIVCTLLGILRPIWLRTRKTLS